MDNKKSKRVIAAGFGTILSILIFMTAVWVSHIIENTQRLQEIVLEHEESEYVFQMRDAAYNRAIALHRMALMDDPFERDDEFMEFKSSAETFIKARDKLLNHNLSEEERLIWQRTKPLVMQGSQVQSEAVREIIHESDIDAANELLLAKVIPTQRQVMNELTSMLGAQKRQLQNELLEASKRNQTTLTLVLTLGLAACAIGVFVAISVIRNNDKAQQELINARIKAQQADHHKSLFLANMSHEIRTPLTSIIGFAETLRNPKQKESLKESAIATIIRNGKHLLSIINDILDLSKIESNKLEIEAIPTDPLEVISDVETIFGRLAREKGLTFSLDIRFPFPKRIITDPLRLKQIIINLVSNAIKFTEHGSIEISAQADADHQRLTVTVNDTGPGMSADAIDKIFQPFTQADASTTRNYGGTGLGLTISRNLAERLGGDLNCHSQPGKGTQFILTLATGQFYSNEMYRSLQEYQQTDDMVFSMDELALSGKVLLAEDSPDIRELILMYLNETGVEVNAVENGQQAVEAAMEQTFDLILMDIQMPVMDGREAIGTLRKAGNQAPIIALTANAMKEDVRQYLALGASNHLPKPIDKNDFKTMLAQYLPFTQELDHVVPDEIADLVEKFKGSLPDMLQKIILALQAEDCKQLGFEAHTLKGLGGSFGFPEITRIAKALETAADDKNMEQARKIAGQLIGYCEEHVMDASIINTSIMEGNPLQANGEQACHTEEVASQAMKKAVNK
jgi:signal transduction histidine kinase/ActR/RegA family two-component response regulator